MSSFLGSSLTFHRERAGSFVMCGEKGAFMRSGVRAHRGSSPLSALEGAADSARSRRVGEVEKPFEGQVVGRIEGATAACWFLQWRRAWRESLAADLELLRDIG